MSLAKVRLLLCEIRTRKQSIHKLRTKVRLLLEKLIIINHYVII